MSAFNPENHLVNIDAKIVASLEKISEVFRVLLWAEAKEHRVSPIQLQLLIFLKYHSMRFKFSLLNLVTIAVTLSMA